MPEPAVEQVQYGVLGAADVQVHRHPVFLFLGVPGGLVVLGIEIAEVIPARSGPLRHRVGLAPICLRVAHPLLRLAQGGLGLAGRLEILELGQPDGQLRLWNRVRLVVLVENDRKWLAPVPLSREQPVAELVVDRALAEPACFQPFGDDSLGLCRRQPSSENAGGPDRSAFVVGN